MSTLKREFRNTVKPDQVEGAGDIYLIRPVGWLLVQGFRRMPISPTGVSLLAVAAGWVSAWFYFVAATSADPTRGAVLGALWLWLHSALDSADGQLARLTGRHTAVGRLIDGACDTAAFFGIYFAIWFGYVWRGGSHPVLAFFLGSLSGYVFAVGSSLVEYVRLLYQDWAVGRMNTENLTPEHLTAGIHQTVGVFGPFFEAWHDGYYGQQRRLLPVTARLEDRVIRMRREDPAAFARFRDTYAREQLPMLRRWWPLAPNAHKAIIAVAGFVPALQGGMLAELGSYWAFLGNLALLPVAWWLIRRQGRSDRRMLERLDALAGDAGDQYSDGGEATR